MAIKRIGLLTSGGDAPGMNAAIRSVVRCALFYNLEVMGIYRGYAGLLHEEIKPLNHRSVSNILNRGGTVLKTDRSEEFKTEEGQKKAVEIIKKNKIDALVLVGGDGTYAGGGMLTKKWGIPCIGVPGTIDNDICGTDFTIGSDTAVNTALDAIDKIRDTATSMERIFVTEVMGHKSGYIAMQVALGGGAEDVLIPEKEFNVDQMCEDIRKGHKRGKISWIIIVSEGAAKAEKIANEISDKTKFETRVTVLGHIQRGGTPTANDRILATRLGAAAVEQLLKGEANKVVGVVANEINVVDFMTACEKRIHSLDELYRLSRMLT